MRPRIHLATCAFNAMPFIAAHLPTFNRLTVPWVWRIAHGVARNVNCSSWCRELTPGLSTDGTTKVLQDLARHPNIRTYEQPAWDGKISMVNRCLADVEENDIVVMIDCDEFWTATQLELIFATLSRRPENTMRFKMRHFFGPHLVWEGGPYSPWPDGVCRAWRAHRGFALVRCCGGQGPESNARNGDKPIIAPETEALGLVFDHYGYFNEAQVSFKERFYGTDGSTDGWRRLLNNSSWPAKLDDYLPGIPEASKTRVWPLV